LPQFADTPTPSGLPGTRSKRIGYKWPRPPRPEIAAGARTTATIGLKEPVPTDPETPFKPVELIPSALFERRLHSVVREIIEHVPFEFKTVPQGAATSVWAAAVASAEEVGGQYCENCHVSDVVADEATLGMLDEGVRGYALDPQNAGPLWKKSEEMTGEAVA
jgi:hypothetical protein